MVEVKHRTYMCYFDDLKPLLKEALGEHWGELMAGVFTKLMLSPKRNPVSPSFLDTDDVLAIADKLDTIKVDWVDYYDIAPSHVITTTQQALRNWVYGNN